MKFDNDDAKKALQISEKIRPMLAGQGSMIQAGVLADLTAIWVSGHYDPEGPEKTRQVRSQILALHVQAIMELIQAIDEDRKKH